MKCWLNRSWGQLLLLSWLVMGVLAAAGQTVPAAFWYELRFIQIADTIAGGDPAADVDRTIHRNVFGEWDVTIWQVEEGGDPFLYCRASGSNHYRAGAARPRRNGLIRFWMEGSPCALEEGKYFATFTWRFHPTLLGAKTLSRDSNTFTVAPFSSSP